VFLPAKKTEKISPICYCRSDFSGFFTGIWELAERSSVRFDPIYNIRKASPRSGRPVPVKICIGAGRIIRQVIQFRKIFVSVIGMSAGIPCGIDVLFWVCSANCRPNNTPGGRLFCLPDRADR
jgi:hypothetical protein